MEDSLHIAEPIALARPRGAHRFEAFSPKLARRVMYYRRPLLEQWLLLEADPNVITFCERPGYVLTDGYRRLADFWVRYSDRHELVFLNTPMIEDNTKTACGQAPAARQRGYQSDRSLRPGKIFTGEENAQGGDRARPCDLLAGIGPDRAYTGRPDSPRRDRDCGNTGRGANDGRAGGNGRRTCAM
ncbi:hypothetical protein [Paraburkholderia hospita]|uniref:hypothetical protein n=1 Tax=Paraburkholderia hospita TaxID=169430 RepID=UPI001F60D8BC|nr:hypothetical protein [Paraburkholderia hospita]